MQINRCECCFEECVELVPVVNRDPTQAHEHDWLCFVCFEVVAQEHSSVWDVPFLVPFPQSVRRRAVVQIAA
jgi:hypothetical protein